MTHIRKEHTLRLAGGARLISCGSEFVVAMLRFNLSFFQLSGSFAYQALQCGRPDIHCSSVSDYEHSHRREYKNQQTDHGEVNYEYLRLISGYVLIQSI